MKMDDLFLIKYEKDGIKIIVTEDKITFHKNGLVIEIPADVFTEFGNTLQEENRKLDSEITKKFQELFGSRHES